nr:MAG TPA: hypothetical protein [Caudoviricetes sp.]
MNKKLDEEFNVLSNDDIKQCSDLQNALELINQENIITEIEAPEPKKFVVQKNSNISNLTKTSLEKKDEEELDEISDQADQAFYDLMNIAINAPGKACGDIASAANNFLTIKLNSRLAKMEQRMKKLTYNLNKQKFEASLKKDDTSNIEENDGIVIIDED